MKYPTSPNIKPYNMKAKDVSHFRIPQMPLVILSNHTSPFKVEVNTNGLVPRDLKTVRHFSMMT